MSGANRSKQDSLIDLRITDFVPIILSRLSKENARSGGLRVHEGKQLKIKCKADGNPVPEIDWLLDGKKIDPRENREYNIQITGNLSALVIQSVEPKHTGNYSCTASNNNGSLSKWVYVSVIREPKESSNPAKSDSSASSSSSNSVPAAASPNNSSLISEPSADPIIPPISSSSSSSSPSASLPCTRQTCVHGTCDSRLNQTHPVCRCPPPFTGIRCDQRHQNAGRTSAPCITYQNNKENAFADTKLIAVVGFGFSVVLVLILLSLVCFYKFRRRPPTYIPGLKCRQFSNKSVQVCMETVPEFPYILKLDQKLADTQSSVLSPFSPGHNQIGVPQADLILHHSNRPSVAHRSPPSGQSSSSAITTNNNNNSYPSTDPRHKILLSVSDIPYTLLAGAGSTAALSSTLQHQQQQASYLYSSLDPAPFAIPISFSCTDPLCCCHSLPQPVPPSTAPCSSTSSSVLTNLMAVHTNSAAVANSGGDSCRCGPIPKTTNTYV